MNAQAQSIERVRRDAPPAIRPGGTALAAPTQSERDERRICSALRAYERLCDAANTFDLRRAELALNEARELLAVDDTIDDVRDALLKVATQGARLATRADVADAVARLVGSFPNFGNRAEAKLFGATLAEDVAAAEPSAMALMIMVRTLRRASKFMPAIAEVLAELDTASRQIDRAWSVVDLLEDRWNAARVRVEKLTTDHEQWLAGQVAAYRHAVASGADVRSFRAEIIAAAVPPDDDVPF